MLLTIIIIIIIIIFILQSLTLPLQGFFNAIIYGWTQEEFVDVVGNKDAPDEDVALINSLPIDSDQGINHQEEYHSPVNGMDKTLTSSRSVGCGGSIIILGTGDMTDYHETELSDTEQESSLEASTTVSVHKV